MLTRKLLESQDFAKTYSALENLFWTPAQLDASLNHMIETCPKDQGIWIFGYGSLIWNPLLEYAEVQPAHLKGWQRDFNIRLLAGRGSEHTPGRMLGLKPEGETLGLAFRLSDDNARCELQLLWMREMLAGVYTPKWCPLSLADGREIFGITFITDSKHPLYESNSTLNTVAALISQASGSLGSNAEYLFSLDSALEQHRMPDSNITELARCVRQIQQNGPTR